MSSIGLSVSSGDHAMPKNIDPVPLGSTPPGAAPAEGALSASETVSAPPAPGLEWVRHLAVLTCGIFIFLTLSGLAITLLPFSVSNQFLVLVHTVGGFAFVPIYLVYQVRHWRRFHHRTLTNVKLLGYSALAATALSVVSGVWVSLEAAFGSRLPPVVDETHWIGSLVAAALLGGHLFLVIRFQRRWPQAEQRASYLAGQRAFSLRVAVVAAALLGISEGGAALYRAGALDLDGYRLPADYAYKYGPNPFAPSLAMTAHGGPIEPVRLAHSRSCGNSGCHEQIVAEWLPSAHRYAAMDLAFQTIQHVMAENEGPESTRYCAGCHDPISLFGGRKNLYEEDLSAFGADEGVSCISCHSIVECDVKGNADYTLAPPIPYAFSLEGGTVAGFLADFLVRAYPGHHVASYRRELYKTPEFCGACHKQFIDAEINKVGWVQLQNQYDNWKNSHWNQSEDPSERITCLECHMRLVDSEDPAAGDALDYNRDPSDRKHRHHGFIAANQFIPRVHGLEGADRHIRLTEEWLRGETVIPEIAHKWRSGPVVTVRIEAPERLRAGENATFRVVAHNNKVGHDFPTGPLDIIQAWVEVVARDGAGRELLRSGTLDAENFIPAGSFIFKAEGIDREGNLIDKHNLWEMVGARFKRALFPDFTDSAEFQLLCPSLADTTPDSGEPESRVYEFGDAAEGPITIEARLLYRKFDQYLLDYALPGRSATSPVTVMASDTATIVVSP
jgi:hypothetical protein